MTAISKRVFPIGNGAWDKPLPRILPEDVSIIIPVKNNQSGINRYLEEFAKMKGELKWPKEIIIVDNGSEPQIVLPNKLNALEVDIRLIQCSTPGPAAARNFGVQQSKGKWLLFNDSDCVPTTSLITGYMGADNGSIGYAGNVSPLAKDYISKYCGSQEILIPLTRNGSEGDKEPLYIITANALVWKAAFVKANGFNEGIKIAGGEDIDLGLRLSGVGKVSFAMESTILHDFSGGVLGFCKRFVRYGYGNRLVQELWGLDLRPKIFRPNKRTWFNEILARLQFVALWVGYLKASWHSNLSGGIKKQRNLVDATNS